MYKLWIKNIDLIDGELEWMTFAIQDFAMSKKHADEKVCGVSNQTFILKLNKIIDYRTGIDESERMDIIECDILSHGIN